MEKQICECSFILLDISGDIRECVKGPLRSWTNVSIMHLLIDTDKLLSNTGTCELKQF